MMEQSRVIGHVVSVNGFRIKVELAAEAKSSSRATPDGVQRAVAINAFLTFDLGAGLHAIGLLSDLEARESFDPARDAELSLELTKPRRIASVQLLGTVRQKRENNTWGFDTGITILPTLDTAAEVANPDILAGIFSAPPKRNEPEASEGENCVGEDYDTPLELGHLTGDSNTKIKASFNDLFSRPLAIVGNTGSGKSYTVASLLHGIIGSEKIKSSNSKQPHVFILDINGEYASSFLPKKDAKDKREPNKAYVNGKELSVPIWLMNTEEICEWLSASEQTQQPVLKAWWASIKSKPKDDSASINNQEFLDDALASIQHMKENLIKIKQSEVYDYTHNIISYVKARENKESTFCKNLNSLKEIAKKYRSAKSWAPLPEEGPEIKKLLNNIKVELLHEKENIQNNDTFVISSDTPAYFQKDTLNDTSHMVKAATGENVSQIDQHLTTLRMRLKAKLADKRWEIFTNYDELGIQSIQSWFNTLGFRKKKNMQKITVLDLSMLSHEVLPFICSVIGRILLETREKLEPNSRYSNPWLIVLEEAHNYARPARQIEDRGQSLSRRAFERIAKEGRKFGLSLIVASQRPSEISPTIISQCANFLSHRLQNPDDIDHFRRIIPKQAQRLLDQVTVLASGEAIAFGSAMHVPARVQINPPPRAPSSTTAAPYVEWGKGNKFPLEKILDNWGLKNNESD